MATFDCPSKTPILKGLAIPDMSTCESVIGILRRGRYALENQMKFVKGDWQRSRRATLVMFSTSVAKYYSIAETILIQ